MSIANYINHDEYLTLTARLIVFSLPVLKLKVRMDIQGLPKVSFMVFGMQNAASDRNVKVKFTVNYGLWNSSTRWFFDQGRLLELLHVCSDCRGVVV